MAFNDVTTGNICEAWKAYSNTSQVSQRRKALFLIGAVAINLTRIAERNIKV